jgi:glycosyltransferase involved in cell wall biosynthesis
MPSASLVRGQRLSSSDEGPSLEALRQAQERLVASSPPDADVHARTLAWLGSLPSGEAPPPAPGRGGLGALRQLWREAFGSTAPAPLPGTNRLERLEAARTFEPSVEVLARTAAGRFSPGPLRHVTWFIPAFSHPFGGVHTLLRFGHLLRVRHGVQSLFVAYTRTAETPRELAARAATVFPEPPGEFHVLQDWDEVARLPPTDLAVATLWTSAYLVPRHPRARALAYFVQDDESLFYASGTYALLAEHTYRLGLYGIFNTRGLHDAITGRHGMQGCWFEPSVDGDIFHPPAHPHAPFDPVRVIFYGRPSTDRNAFELGLAALRRLKAIHGDRVDIVSAGESWDPAAYGVRGVVRNLGVLGYERTGALYRTCQVGLCFMFSRHPSYLPLEWMASGVAVVTNDNPDNHWLLEHGRNCLLARPTVEGVEGALTRAVMDGAFRASLAAEGLARMKRTRWESAVDRVHAALTGAAP